MPNDLLKESLTRVIQEVAPVRIAVRPEGWDGNAKVRQEVGDLSSSPALEVYVRNDFAEIAAEPKSEGRKFHP